MNPRLAISKALTQEFFYQFPDDAVQALEKLPLTKISKFISTKTPSQAANIMEKLSSETAAEVLNQLADKLITQILRAMNPSIVASLLSRLEEDSRKNKLNLLDPYLAKEIAELMTYPPNSAGHLMDPNFITYRPHSTVRDVIQKMRKLRKRRILDVFLVDENHSLIGVVPLQKILLAPTSQLLRDLVEGVSSYVHAISPRDDVVDLLKQKNVTSLPVVDANRRMVGVIRYKGLMQAIQEEATADLQMMVGVSQDERALSPAFFSVRKRLPWLNINLLTAFLAAGVVGIFEGTIAKITALAVLLPVVAGQSGNTGAQALAVTMRGLALREVRIRQWAKILLKESAVGFINGTAIALVTSAGVLIWSHSLGLSLVIGVAMIFSMIIASISGAAIPILLTAFKQDPAQSSSIILTTVTDVMGFLSFLGLATLFSHFLL